MSTYVLIIIFVAWDTGGTTTQEFTSKKSCESAREWVQTHWKYGDEPRVKAMCFKK